MTRDLTDAERLKLSEAERERLVYENADLRGQIDRLREELSYKARVADLEAEVFRLREKATRRGRSAKPRPRSAEQRRRSGLLATRIQDLEFSKRVHNCLARTGIETLGDLVSRSTRVRQVLREKGLALRG